MIDLNESTFFIYAAKHYDNPFCQDVEEFEDDIKRFHYVKKLINKYVQSGILKDRLILNHLIVIYNCFGLAATNMLFMKLDGSHEQLVPFISFLNYLPDKVVYSGVIINTNSITPDAIITEKLRDIGD